MQNSWINVGNKSDNFNTIEVISPDRCRSIDLYNTPFVSPVDVLSINRLNVHEVDKFYKVSKVQNIFKLIISKYYNYTCDDNNKEIIILK